MRHTQYRNFFSAERKGFAASSEELEPREPYDAQVETFAGRNVCS
jgi:hypothetical protein